MKKYKVLVSLNFGAGFASWATTPEQAKFLAEYKPLIEAVEGGLSLAYITEKEETWPDVLKQLNADFEKRFSKEVYLGGASTLEVMEVTGMYKITEYDGAEELHTMDEDSGWIVPG